MCNTKKDTMEFSKKYYPKHQLPSWEISFVYSLQILTRTREIIPGQGSSIK